MKIDFTHNQQQNTSFQKGVYFVKNPSIIFEKKQKVIVAHKDIFSVSQDGFKYIENKNIKADLKNRITNAPFIKELAEKFDTFVYLSKPLKNDYYNKKYYSHMKIKWAENKKCDVIGGSADSAKAAVASMLNNLETQNFF